MAVSMRIGSPGKKMTRAKNLDFAIRTLKTIDPESHKAFQESFKTQAKQIGRELKENIPRANKVPSGFQPRNAAEGSFYVYKKPTMKIVMGSRNKGRRRTGGRSLPVVKIVFSDRRPTAGFSILELAGTENRNGITYRGRNLIRGLRTKGMPLKDGGRFVIPEFYDRRPEILRMAELILLRYAKRVNADLAKRVERGMRMR